MSYTKILLTKNDYIPYSYCHSERICRRRYIYNNKIIKPSYIAQEDGVFYVDNFSSKNFLDFCKWEDGSYCGVLKRNILKKFHTEQYDFFCRKLQQRTTQNFLQLKRESIEYLGFFVDEIENNHFACEASNGICSYCPIKTVCGKFLHNLNHLIYFGHFEKAYTLCKKIKLSWR